MGPAQPLSRTLTISPHSHRPIHLVGGPQLVGGKVPSPGLTQRNEPLERGTRTQLMELPNQIRVTPDRSDEVKGRLNGHEGMFSLATRASELTARPSAGASPEGSVVLHASNAVQTSGTQAVKVFGEVLNAS